MEDEFGEDKRVPNPWDCNPTRAIAIEAEISQTKTDEHIAKNHQENKTRGRRHSYIL